MLRGARAPVLGGAVDLPQAADTNGLAEVDVARDGGGAHVEPVDILGGKLLGGAGLDQLNPSCAWLAGRKLAWARGPLGRNGEGRQTRDGELALALQESRVGIDELLRLKRRKGNPTN